jgi:hypothetical protein
MLARSKGRIGMQVEGLDGEPSVVVLEEHRTAGRAGLQGYGETATVL